jgi:preprotein translocase subunit Sss1
MMPRKRTAATPTWLEYGLVVVAVALGYLAVVGLGILNEVRP